MENRITAFIRKKISLYNNVRLPKSMYRDILYDVKVYLIRFILSEFNEYKNEFVFEKDKLIQFPRTKKFGDEYKPFYETFIKILNEQKQESYEIQKYGSHDFIITAVKDILYEIYACFIY